MAVASSKTCGGLLYNHVGEEMPTFDQVDFRGETERNDTQVVMPTTVSVNAKVWVSVFWVSTSGKPGVVSLLVFTWTNHGQMQNDAEGLNWIDARQKAESDKLGFLPATAIQKRIELGNVLVADAPASGLLGYCIAVDRYMKQDHVGQFIQLNLHPEHRRRLVGAALVRATFEKSAWGVKLFGLWCRQDLPANRFWEALGFVPLAFRVSGIGNTTSKKKAADPRRRVHVYWQRRVRTGDDRTPYWFPYETQGGQMAESRVVLPIPPRSRWDEVEPVAFPGAEEREAEALRLERSAAEGPAAETQRAELAAVVKQARETAKEAERASGEAEVVHGVETKHAAAEPMGFAAPPDVAAQQEAAAKAEAVAAKKRELAERKRAAKAAAKAARRKSDPRLLAFSRELRDRWGEAVSGRPELIGLGCEQKYELGRLVEGDFATGIGFALPMPHDASASPPLLGQESPPQNAEKEAA
ncbi:MAG: GNAT family N-acetyltransferase [Planctomycetota bacterium]